MPDQVRNQLAALIDEHSFQAPSYSEEAADAVLKAGWRPPARVITDPADLDALAPFSVVLGYGIAHQAIPDDRAPVLWIKPTGRPQTSAELLADCPHGGVTVLHDTRENGDTE